MKITLICGYGKNREIGENNALLWDLPKDMDHFRKRTAGGIVVMGRTTYESIGRPLPKRRNIILTRNRNFTDEKVEIFHDITPLLKTLEEENISEIFVIGGGNIYSQFLPLATHLSITLVDQSFPNADAFFPDWSEYEKDFTLLSEKKILPDEVHLYGFSICEYQKN